VFGPQWRERRGPATVKIQVRQIFQAPTRPSTHKRGVNGLSQDCRTK
jgi:hypothetical protein